MFSVCQSPRPSLLNQKYKGYTFFNPFKSSEGKMAHIIRRKQGPGMHSLNCLLRNKGC